MTGGRRVGAGVGVGVGVAWIVALAAAVLVLHACAGALPAPPWPPTTTALGDWLQTRGSIGAAFSILRVLALAVAWYLVAVTGLTVLARLSGSRPLAHLAVQLTPRLARAALRPLLGAGLSVSLLGAPAPLLVASVAHATPAPAASPAATIGTPGASVAAHILRTDLGPTPSRPTDGPAPTIVVTPLGDEPGPPSIPGTTTADHVDEQPTTTAPTPTTTLPPPGRMSPAEGVDDETPPDGPPNQPSAEVPPTDAPTTTHPPPHLPTTTTTTTEPTGATTAPPSVAPATAIGRSLADAGRVAASDLGRAIGPPDRWIIAPGDHLWHVAEATLTRSWGRSPTDAEITPYWDALIAANRDRLADPDNPDLVLPGQELLLPPPPPTMGP